MNWVGVEAGQPQGKTKNQRRIEKITRKVGDVDREALQMIPTGAGCLIIYILIIINCYRKSSKNRSFDESYIVKNGYQIILGLFNSK